MNLVPFIIPGGEKRDLPQGFLSGERGGGKGANSSWASLEGDFGRGY